MSFWLTKKLTEMSHGEWESLCDRCGQCCLHKLEDEDTEQIAFTRVACDFIDIETCRCSCYSQRTEKVSYCIDLKQHDFSEYKWLPATCAYRLLSENQPLPQWHPLITGNANSVREAGVTISDYAVKESEVEDMEDYIIAWLD